MRILIQLAIILFVGLAGEVLNRVVGIPVPGNVLGMLLMFILLCLKIVKVEHVEKCAEFFLKNLAFFFVPAGVGLISVMGPLRGQIIAVILICMVSTAFTILATGHSVQLFNKFFSKRKNTSTQGAKK